MCVLPGASTTIMKQCASWATCSGAASTASVDSNGNGNKVGCCNGYDLCNFSSGGMVRAHTTLLLLTVGVLLLRTHWGQHICGSYQLSETAKLGALTSNLYNVICYMLIFYEFNIGCIFLFCSCTCTFSVLIDKPLSLKVSWITAVWFGLIFVKLQNFVEKVDSLKPTSDNTVSKLMQ